MLKEEIFENRRAVAKKICQDIRANGGRMAKAKYFSERPYNDGKKSYKFSSANFLRLLSSDNEIICEGDPRWLCVDEIKNNDWTVQEDAIPKLLEVWNRGGKQECSLIEFYNVADILGQEKFKSEEETLESVLEFLRERGLLESSNEIISFEDGIEAVKKYAEKIDADELTSILTIQTWLVQSKLKTKLDWFLPTYSETILAEIEKSPDIIFESMSKAQAILKNLRQEKIKSVAENNSPEKLFRDLKVVYHGSEDDLQNKNGFTYPKESILMGISAYDFLLALKSAGEQKIWLEFSYKDYSHGKFLISGEDFAFDKEEFITPFLRTRLDKNRQYLLDNPQELRRYITGGKNIRVAELLSKVQFESEHFLSVMVNFAQEEISYLEIS